MLAFALFNSDIPPDIESITISVYNKGKRSKDAEIATMKLYLCDLSPGQLKDEWFNLDPINLSTKGDTGSLRVSVRYLHEVIMPLKEYTTFKEVTTHTPVTNHFIPSDITYFSL